MEANSVVLGSLAIMEDSEGKAQPYCLKDGKRWLLSAEILQDICASIQKKEFRDEG